MMSIWRLPALPFASVPMFRIWVGAARSVLVPSPSCPNLFAPHVHTEPSRNPAAVYAPGSRSFPAATAPMTLPNPGTGAGVERLVNVPSPSSPNVLSPHAHSVPSALTPTECRAPAEMLRIPKSAGTAVGRVVHGPSTPKPSGHVSLETKPSWP